MLASIFLGTSGKYDVGGIEVHFTEDVVEHEVFGRTWFGHLVHLCLSNNAIKILTLSYLHLFIHEMGHALARKLLVGGNCTINIYTENCQGETSGISTRFTAIAGPLMGMMWELAKLIGAIVATTLFPSFLPVGIFIGAGAAFWLFGEVMYAVSGQGDWDV